jgi:glycogen(starch) synthase
VADELGAPAGTVTVVPNGVDPEHFAPVTAAARQAARRALGLPAAAFVVTFAGEYHTNRKGLDALLAAVAAGDEHLVVAGSGPRRALAAAADRLGCGARVHVVGFGDARTVVAAADAVAVPSRYEPFSIVALEAASSCVPLALSVRAGAAEHLAEVAHLVGEPVDAGAVRRALDRLRALAPDERASRLAEGRAIAERLAWPACAARAAEVVEAAAGALLRGGAR